MVLEMVVGPVDRGACIRELSQYPKQIEYLYLPLSFVSPDGDPRFTVSAGGLGVRIFPVRININLSARTVEELLGQKKRMHCAAFHFLSGELDVELACRIKKGDAAARLAVDNYRDAHVQQQSPYSVEDLRQKIMEQFKEVLRRQEAREAGDYADDTTFQGLVSEMLDARRWAVSKLRLWLEDRTEYIYFVVGYSLREAHRRLVAYLARAADAAHTTEKGAAALEVCKERGLLQAGVDEANDAGEAPLVAAAADGAAAADILLLIAARSAVNGVDGEPSAAATAAAKYGHADVLIALLKAKAAVNASNMVCRCRLYCVQL